ncbi:MAG TPA: serine/threonine-protein kinase [Pseudomonadota bacterium]|nr:serine/threonine-protein kinase [Pseudomonadota bacterium]HNN52005.1 serine/threonine-protein kinase [Pseudomonadota bacterium]HNO69074.1 serine/threonine-protein kinase [Pseudomonadota bacterium]
MSFNPKFGKYELLAHLATGGMAEIYLARMAGSDGFSKLVVVKRLLADLAKDKEYVQMFLDEARINARLNHSNIVQVLELGEVDGQYFIAMEYVSGLSVAQVGKLATQRLGEVPQNIACGILLQACAGLHHAHETKLSDSDELGIIHRDVSPQNLLLTYEGFVKVVDFGIAKAEGRETRTQAGMVKGKFAYMSPEQCTGQKVDRRTDIFALGVILFELCTSRRLFKRATPIETYEAIQKGEVPDPCSVSPQVSRHVGDVILKALARNKDERYLTAEAMQEALELAMRRSGLKGRPLDLSRFLDSNFQAEIKEQEDLVRRIAAGELTQPENQHAAESSKLADNYAHVDDLDIEEDISEIEDPTSSDMKAPDDKPATPPPPVPSLANRSAQIAQKPVSMVLPTIDPKKALQDMLSGKAPNMLGDQLQGLAKAANVTAPPPEEVAPAAPAPAASSPSGQGLAPSASTPTSNNVGNPSGQGQAPATPPSALQKLADLPLPLLIGIAFGLAVLSAIVTALLIF